MTYVEAMKDKLVMEQLIEMLPSHVCVWVKERKPKMSKEAGEYVNDYFQARGPQFDSPSLEDNVGCVMNAVNMDIR